MVLQLPVDNWDSLELSQLLVVVHSDEDKVSSGWMLWDVQVMRPV